MSGVLTTGALVATFTAPFAGRIVDRYGSRAILSGSSLLMGIFAIILSFTVTPLMFYIPFTLGRALFVGPLEVGMSTSVSNWSSSAVRPAPPRTTARKKSVSASA